ncbi:FAD-dependent monooxygenase [Microbulbifer sp. OS29]|uniref:FAD-dependent monooxygenase n=1 Tax=Microbulbifer okhotskensis TaxID=2926617 RepID=A0A9X2EXG3_9GAMM|nr:FAD-dependent monooxygenase [Microbulbifer okhotskensis]MCO1337008.1 FAD-dependent monooxygenase [Microbulbifer okhotskensis]
MKVLVVGAGPTGLTVAVELARLGLLPRVIDRRDSASTLSRAVGITSRSLELLSKSGVSEKLIAEGIAVQAACIYLDKQLALEFPLHSDRTYFPTILGLPQDRTEALMDQVLSSMGVEVEYQKELISLSEYRDGVVAQFDTGDEDRFDLVIGADGIRSTVREAAGINFPGFDLEEEWSIADVDTDGWPPRRKFTLVKMESGLVAVAVPLGEGRHRLVASCEDAIGAFPMELDIKRVRRQGTFKVSIRQAETYSRGRVHLAGDAAHCHSPVGGRGMNLGIADAVELAARIVAGRLTGYSELRHREDKKVIDITERGRKIVTGKSLKARFEFRALIAAANSLPAVRRKLGQFVVEF